MPLGHQTFDVVVVGVTDAGRGNESSVAAELAARCRLPVANVKLALQQGELTVHRGVEGQLARRLQAQLRDLGANAVARPAEDSMETPIIEEDPEEVPELISAKFDGAESRFDLPEPPLTRDSPIAPPPDFGGRPPASAAPGLDPSRPQGRAGGRAERPFGTPEDARTQRFAPVASGGGRPAAQEIEDIDAPTARYEPVPTQRRGLRPRPAHDPRAEVPVASGPVRAESSSSGNALDDLVGTLEAAAASGGSFGVVTLDGIDHDKAPEQPKPSSASSSAPNEERAHLVEEEGVAVPRAKAVRQGPPPEAGLQLERTGTPVAGASASGMGRPSASMAGPASMAGASTSGFRPQYAGTSGAYAQAPPLDDLDGPRKLFVTDTVTNYLVGVTLGLIVGLVVALASRGSFRDEIQDLEDELASSYIRPLDVAAGDLPAPETILSELDDMYSGAQRHFLMRMFLVGIPLGLIAGRIRLG